MPKQDNYICPRCEYCTPIKRLMRKHFNRKTPCALEYNLVLTDEIKDFVLLNRKYILPKERTAINLINNWNCLNNVICKMDIDQKISRLLEYQDIPRIDFEDQLDDFFSCKNSKFETDYYKVPFILDQNEIMGLINDVTKIDKDNINKLNVVFDKTVKILKIWSGHSWNEYLEDAGGKKIVDLLKSYFLNYYELYLIRKLHQDGQSGFNRSEIKEHLVLYYRFIAIYDLIPDIINHKDMDVLGHCLVESNDQFLAATYMDLYHQEKKNLKKCDINNVKKQVIAILKNNTIHNISELNQAILDIIKCDHNFKQLLVDSVGIVDV